MGRRGVLPLTTAYSVSETFGFRKGVNLDFRRAPVFVGVFSALVAIGAAAALIPNVPLIQLLVLIQVLNGALLPVILVFILVLVNDRSLVGDLKNTRLYNVLGWATFAFVTIAVAALFGSQLLEALGIPPLGGG
jgi:Mn2+/Fe2+ NRAMP family transporter